MRANDHLNYVSERQAGTAERVSKARLQVVCLQKFLDAVRSERHQAWAARIGTQTSDAVILGWVAAMAVLKQYANAGGFEQTSTTGP
jgi:hypothetical protein